MSATRETRWWLSEPAAVALDVVALVRRLWDDDEPRRQRLERAARLYGPGLHMTRWQTSGLPMLGGLSMNVVRALVQTASSTLLQNSEPAPWFLTDGGDYVMQQKADAMSKATVAVLARCAFDEQARGDTLLSAALGTAVTKIFERDGEPCTERVFPWELLVDERDGYDGKPRSLYQIAWVDRAVLLGRFGKDAAAEDDDTDELDPVADAIRHAGTAGLDDATDHDTTTDQVCVIEAWHLASKKGGTDGRHIICTDAGVLVDEPWKEPTFPFAFLHWGARLTGFWGPGIADEIWTIQAEINLTLLRIRRMLAFAAPRVFVEKGSKVTSAPMTNEEMSVNQYTGRPPIIDTSRVVPPEMQQYLEYLWGKCFALLGISELSSAAIKPAGLDSGEAQRVYADLTSGRMALWGRNWQAYHLDVSRAVVAQMRRGRGRREVTYIDEKKREKKTFAWADIALPEGDYEIRCFPVSSLPSTAEGRMARLDEWRNSKLIDDAQYRRLVNIPDLTAETSLLDAPRDACEAAVDEMLNGSGRYIPPTSFDDLALCLRFGNLHLVRARIKGYPDDRIELLERYLVEAQQLMAPAPAAPAPVDPAAAGMVPAGAPPPPAFPDPAAPPMAA